MIFYCWQLCLFYVTLHVSVWVEIFVEWNIEIFQLSHAPRERVSWNMFFAPIHKVSKGHAPRERVSWNSEMKYYDFNLFVTLHVSVWVEIELFFHSVIRKSVTLHVSVWVEIFCSFLSAPCQDRHAPRERVSWNLWGLTKICVLWVTLHVSVWVEMHFWFHKIKIVASRSTWACELKSLYSFRSSATCFVTLHVSVWVEIRRHFLQNFLTKVTLHVSVWVEIPTIHRRIRRGKSHAPRERVSWNDIFACHQSPF